MSKLETLEAAQAAAAFDHCRNTVAALKLAYNMLCNTHASITLLQQMEELVDLAEEELDLSDE